MNCQIFVSLPRERVGYGEGGMIQTFAPKGKGKTLVTNENSSNSSLESQ
jgi:hypothetical protein